MGSGCAIGGWDLGVRWHTWAEVWCLGAVCPITCWCDFDFDLGKNAMRRQMRGRSRDPHKRLNG